MSPWGGAPGGYGQTEATAILTARALATPRRGGHGRPLPVAEVRVVDDDGEELPAGEVGEIVARSPTLMLGYLHQAEENAARSKDGWFYTTDLGRREEDGSITFLGTASRLIKTGGENVYPAEVEQCIRSIESVAEVAVVGLPDRVWGERVAAVVVPKAGFSLEVAEITAHCQDAIAGYKKPREIMIASAIPRLSHGAADDDALREMLMAREDQQ